MSENDAFDIVASGLGFPEGPVWLPDGDVLVVETRAGLVTSIGTDGSRTVVASVGGGPNGAAFGPDGWLYVVNNGGFAWSEVSGTCFPLGPDGGNQLPDHAGGWIDRVDVASGAIERVADSAEGQRFLGPNDLVFDEAGGLWFTDFGKLRPRSMDRGAIYYLPAGGAAPRRVAENLIGPNGIGLSPAGDRLYVAETYTGRLLAWNVERPGRVNGGPTIVVATPEHLDSLAVEADGTVVVAAIRGLLVVRPDGGTRLIPTPGTITSNICFGGDDLRTAYVTASGSGQVLALPWPRPGLRLAYTP